MGRGGGAEDAAHPLPHVTCPPTHTLASPARTLASRRPYPRTLASPARTLASRRPYPRVACPHPCVACPHLRVACPHPPPHALRRHLCAVSGWGTHHVGVAMTTTTSSSLSLIALTYPPVHAHPFARARPHCTLRSHLPRPSHAVHACSRSSIGRAIIRGLVRAVFTPLFAFTCRPCSFGNRLFSSETASFVLVLMLWGHFLELSP
jgi:hypothetical protein